MVDSRKLAGYLMITSAVTHTSELFVFGNSLRNGYIHPYTIWHLAVDFTVVPICVYQLRKSRSRTSAT